MRHAIADSDDEGDDEVYVSASTSYQNHNTASNQTTKDADGEGANDADVVKNTNSTELLRQRMLSAERHLVSNSAPMAASGALQSSPSMRVQKRRHSTVFGAGAATSPEKAVKRTKTLTTYGSKGIAHTTDRTAFDSLHDDPEAAAPKTSQSARFTEHSGYHSSADLPTGSFGLEFANHEPAVMFRDSGSTVADGSSTQHRMLEQALSSKKGTSTSAVQQAIEEEEKSSSFPWTPSEQTRSVKSTGRVKARAHDPDGNGGGGEDAAHAKDDDGVSEGSVQRAADGVEEVPQAIPSKHNVDDYDVAKPNAEPTQNDAEDNIAVGSAARPYASPVVEITQTATRTTKTSRRDSASSSKSSKTSKGESEQAPDSEPLNSDDKAIGLPKERYQPRPSRRRATQIIEEPIDYSIVPEKAAKAKRRKTANAPTNSETSMSKEHLASLKADVEKVKTPPTTSHEQLSGIDKTSNATNEDHAPSPANEGAPLDGNQTSKETPSQPSQSAEETWSSLKKKKDEHVFAKPALPTPKPKSASQSRRSRTTIFEDHVEFAGTQKPPTLAQQQATRKLAQEDFKTAATKPSQRKRKTIVDDDEDDEDELAKDPGDDPEPEKEEPVPTKRGRGRPAKAKPQAKSAEKVLEDSDGEDEDHEEEDEPPKKKGRGRPPKATTAPKSAAAETNKTTSGSEGSDSTPALLPAETAAAKTATVNLTVHHSNSTGGIVGKENLTPSPSPEKPEDKPDKSAQTPQKDAKQDTTLHSPIKSTLAVPLRVGLSRGRRIPSLLKMIKPPKPKT